MQYRIRNGDQVVGTVGGRNLVTGTGQDFVIDDSASTAKQGWRFQIFNLTQQLKVGDQITVSAEGTLTGRGDLSAYEAILYNSSVTAAPRSLAVDLTPGKRASATLTVANLNGVGDTALLIYAGKISDTEGKKLILHHLKVELGTVATPWSPAPEDYGITAHNNAYRVTGLAPSTTYQLSVTPFNGLREGPKETVTVHTRGLHVTVPTQLPVGATYNLTYEEYALGLVPIGTEPAGMFGGGNRQTVPAKVISSSGSTSVLEITSSFNLIPDNMTMKQLPDGSFAAYEGYKALFFNK